MKKLLLIICIAIFVNFSYAKTITDMQGNAVFIKDDIKRVFSSSPPMMALLYTLAPEYMIGVNYRFLEVEKTYMLKEIQYLPVLGGFFGSGQQASLEKLISLKPDIVFAWDRTLEPESGFIKTLQKVNIPIFQIRQNNFEDSIAAINLMGEVLNKQERAQSLTKYAKDSLSRVKQSVELLDKDKKIRVFFAQGLDGLMTECESDVSSEIITLAGGINVHSCDINKSTKREKITLEKLYKYDPDIIFVREKSTFDDISKSTSTWRNLKAHKNNKIFLAPSSPFAWLSRPPSFMRFLGLPWMHKKMYPDHFEFDENKETKNFYELFLHVKLEDSDVEKLFKGE